MRTNNNLKIRTNAANQRSYFGWSDGMQVVGKATLFCPLWANRIVHFGHKMLDPFGQNNINHLVQVSLEFFCVDLSPESWCKG